MNPEPPKDNAGIHPDATAFGKCDKAEVHEFSKNLENTSNFCSPECESTEGRTELCESTEGRTELCESTEGRTELCESTEGRTELCENTEGRTELFA